MATNAGNYTVTAANSAGSVTSSVAVLTVSKAAETATLGSLNQIGWVLYTQPAGYTNADSLTYVISDGTLQTTGTVAVAIINDTNAAQNLEFSQSLGNGSTLTSFLGIPGRTYSIQYTTNLATAAWVDIATNLAATNGVITVPHYFRDLGSNPPAASYYQLKWQP
jgi:hypothetical protein